MKQNEVLKERLWAVAIKSDIYKVALRWSKKVFLNTESAD